MAEEGRIHPAFIYRETPTDPFPRDLTEDDLPWDPSRGQPEIGQYRILRYDEMGLPDVEVWQGLPVTRHWDFGWEEDEKYVAEKRRLRDLIRHEETMPADLEELQTRRTAARAAEMDAWATMANQHDWRLLRKNVLDAELAFQEKKRQRARMQRDLTHAGQNAFPDLTARLLLDLGLARREAWRRRREKEWDDPTNASERRHFEARRTDFWEREYAYQDAEIEGEEGKQRWRDARAASVERKRREEEAVDEAFRERLRAKTAYEARWGPGSYSPYKGNGTARRGSASPPRRGSRDGRSRTPPSRRAGPPSDGLSFAQQAQAWLTACSDAFSNYEVMTAFPLPPPRACANVGHKAEDRRLEACACNVRDCFERLNRNELKNARTLFHPDKFSRCREDLREGFQGFASELFVVADALWKEKK